MASFVVDPDQDAPAGAAARLAPVVTALLGPRPPVRIRAWDGSELGDPSSRTTVVVRDPAALRRLLWAPGELGLARAHVAGELDVEGDIEDLLGLRDLVVDDEGRVGLQGRGWLRVLRAAASLGALGLPPSPPAEEARLRGRRHSKRRDADAIAHHYDVSNEFYRLFLGETMTYSCAYFPADSTSLDDAQRAKYELISRKLDLRRGRRLLDVGCGWGGMVLHAAEHHGVEAVGVTISERQAALARERVAAAGLQDRVEIRLCDYRDVDDGPYDAVSSIGMFEHVGLSELAGYFERLGALVAPGGRVLNHGISRPSGQGAMARRGFIQRYVFPDGELHEVGRVVTAMQDLGFEVRDVESLREHYARTLRCWVAALERSWSRAVELVGEGRARVWRLYMAASALNFAEGRTSIHQVLAVKPGPRGAAGMPATRAGFAAVGTEDVSSGGSAPRLVSL